MRLTPALTALILIAAVSNVHASIIALDSNRASGNQSYSGNLGMDFDVLSPIYVTHLGAYDSNQDGIAGQGIEVGIFDRNTQSLVTGVSTITSADALTGKSRFEDIVDVLLPIGEYSIVAIGYSGTEMNGNSGSVFDPSTINDGGGLISFVGGSRYLTTSDLAFPTTLDSGPANRYDAGTFIYADASSVPAPAGLALLGIGLLGLRFGQRAKHTTKA